MGIHMYTRTTPPTELFRLKIVEKGHHQNE